MLHPPTSENKTKNQANNSYSPPVAEQEHRLHPPSRGQSALSSWGRELSNHRQENLQKTYGNQAVLRMNGGVLQRKCACGTGNCAECQSKREGTLQTKLRISEPGDKYEQEADRIADQVMRMPEPTKEETVQRKAIANSITPLQSSSTGQDSEVPPIVDEVLRSPGQPLDAETRAFMESRFSYDFSQVRVHTDSKAAESARAVNALAYTVGSDIAFGSGGYAPRTEQGKSLLAHELTHIIQEYQGQNSSKSLNRSNLLYRSLEDEETDVPETLEDNTNEVSPSFNQIPNNFSGVQASINCQGNDIFKQLPYPYYNSFFQNDGTEVFCVTKKSITVTHTAQWSPVPLKGVSTFIAVAKDTYSTWSSPEQTWEIDPTKEKTNSFNLPSPGGYWLSFKVKNNPNPKKRQKLIVAGKITEP